MDMVYLLIHGNSGSSKDMNFISKQLPDNCKIYNFDLPYHGKNASKLNQLTIESCAEYLVGKIPDNSDMTIIGHSDGANIAMNIPWISSLNITNLILISPNVNFYGISDGWLKLFNAIASFTRLFPVLEKYHKRMNMMITYKYRFGKLNIPTKLFYAKNDVIKNEEKLLVADMCNTEIIEIDNTTHFTIATNKILLEKIRRATVPCYEEES